MKDTDKVTLTFGQLKSLITEAKSKRDPFKKFVTSVFNAIDEDNFPYEMRYKGADCEDIDEVNHIGNIYWETEEDFDGYDFNKFIKEVRRCVKLKLPLYKDITYPFKIKVKCISRDGRWAGYGTRTLSF